MKKLFDLKFIFIAIFLLLTIAIKNSENFQLRDFSDGVSETDSSKVSKSKHSTKIRYPFRKLEKIEESAEDNDDDDDDEDENDSEEDKTDYTFAKVRKPTFEVKKRTNLRYSKLAQFRDPKDTQNDDDDDEDDEKISFFTRIVNFSKRKPKTEEEEEDSSTENESKENTSDDSAEVNSKEDDTDDPDDDDELEDKPILTEIFDKFKDFLEARSKQSKQSDDDDESSGDASGETDDDEDDENSGEDESEPESEKIEKKPVESKIKISIKETISTIFNRVPFNLVFDFDDDDDEGEKLEDSEEDEINYQRLLKEEREHMHQHVDQLIKQSSEEDAKPSAEVEPSKVEDVKASTKPKKEKKSKEEAHLAQKEFEKLLLNLPSFVPDYSKVKNPECQKQGEVFQRQLRGQRIWALQMMDATAKIPSGLMRGNTNQLGDFDLCTKISQKIKVSESSSMKMKGKYCLANIDVVAAADQLKLPVHLIQGRNFIRSTINDPNHFFPRYSTINWGLCLPSACTYHDADQILESFIGPYNSTGIKLHINVNEDSCYVRHHLDIVNLVKHNLKIFGTCIVIGIIVIATIVATLNDYLDAPIFSFLTSSQLNKNSDENSEETQPKKLTNGIFYKLLNCFSAKRNASSLINAKEDDVLCLHGLKAVSIILLFLSFKLIPMGRVPYSNRNKLTEFFNSPFSVFLRSSFLYEDAFLVISGLLASLSISKDLTESVKLSWIKKIVGRFLRLVLPLTVVLLFYAYIWEHLGTGPQWSSLVDKNADLCKDNMWRNLLFIQNFYPIEDMCATHTYHLAVDLQLFVLAPLLIWLIYKQPTYGIGLYGVLHAFSAAARFSSTVENRLSLVVFHGMKLSQLYRTFNLSLDVALHRFTPYLIGISLGVIVKEFGKVQLPRGIVASGWISAVCGLIWCFYTPSNLSHKDYQYDPAAAAQYSALASLLWSLSIAWIIFACYSDASWKLNCILSSRPMIFISKISYSIYLVVFLVLFYFSGTLKSGEEFHLSSYIDRLEMFVVLVVATLFTLCVDLPMQNIVKLLLKSGEKPENKTNENGNAESNETDDDFESPFADRDDDFVYKPIKLRYDSSINNGPNVNGDYLNGNGNINEETEETDEEQEIEEEVVETSKPKPENNMNARRWKWEVLDD